ncbi:unnamed protein product [Cladocopium goreaui]|uniref:Uncharacterized protein n=1 Tax=Cladocopium goreaui TaxID=2562237 RepID=A0A9P1CYA6_9DINO|nr:unnamed protein product [Cladocopium goreaui]
MVGAPQHALKTKLGIEHSQAAAFQEATASFQLAKLLMRVCQIAFLVLMEPSGIVYMAYVVMFFALWVPVIFVWGAGVTGLWVVYLQYILGGVAVGLFEGTFLSVISSLGKNTKTFAIMAVTPVRHGNAAVAMKYSYSTHQTWCTPSPPQSPGGRLPPRRRCATEVATAMHETIPADRWCVTWADLKYLRKSVKSAIRKEVIQPPEDGRDDFLMVDEVYGPSIYTVNEQYIKPITHFHGKMSWALMRNPAGLDCDMFISHAWLEGIFEFLRKVLHSWPRGVRTAWCCMLANPQNLNIEAFLQSPSKSPFALALRASEVVLVVPNRHVSVYTRLWCAYEAYIADQEGKTILIAKTSNLQGIIFAMLPMAVAALIGAMLGSYARHHWQHCARQVTYVGGVASVAAYNVQHNQCRMLLNLFCEMICFEKIVHWEPAFQWAKAGRVHHCDVLVVTAECRSWGPFWTIAVCKRRRSCRTTASSGAPW